MSRVGKRPITVPQGVTVSVDGSTVAVKGPKGELSRTLPELIGIALEDGVITCTRPNDTPTARALHGLTRALINNMVIGVTEGFSKSLEIQGVGYKAEPKPYGLNLVLGFSHPVKYEVPKGITVSVDNNVLVKIEGIDKEQVGQVAAEIRGLRPPEPYKGKGVRYVGEHVRRKAGKTAAAK